MNIRAVQIRENWIICPPAYCSVSSSPFHYSYTIWPQLRKLTPTLLNCHVANVETYLTANFWVLAQVEKQNSFMKFDMQGPVNDLKETWRVHVLGTDSEIKMEGCTPTCQWAIDRRPKKQDYINCKLKIFVLILEIWFMLGQ